MKKMTNILIKQALLLNEDKAIETDIYIKQGRIDKILPYISGKDTDLIIDAQGQRVIPGMIDDQVHFREPGLTYKGDIYSESRAAVAGGITSFMDMPNTKPPTLNLDAINHKKAIAAQTSVANYGFHLGASRDNLQIVASIDPKQVAGVKVFMGASTGNMLLDDEASLNYLFAHVPTILLAHCEHTPTIIERENYFKQQYGDAIKPSWHAQIRSHEACYRSSSLAVSLAKKHGTRLHILHLTTAQELALFEDKPTAQKQITAEACIHHLFFDERDYLSLGNLLKCNPSVKTLSDKQALQQAVAGQLIDIIATDHAPHTLAEKQASFWQAPSGLPLVQHAIPALWQLVYDGVLDWSVAVAKTSHRVADVFAIAERGYVREGYWADLVLLKEYPSGVAVSEQAILSRCGWTPFAQKKFNFAIDATIVSGQLAYYHGQLMHSQGMALAFTR